MRGRNPAASTPGNLPGRRSAASAPDTGRGPNALDGPVGDNDFRISDMGSDQDYDDHDPDVAYNTADNE